MLKCLFILLIILMKMNRFEFFELDLELNEEEMYSVLDEISLEVEELEDVLLSCNENAELYTKSTIKNLFRSDHFNRIDDESKNLVLGWQILNTQKQFNSNLTYLLIKQITFKDAGIYYCIFRVPYLSFLSSILPNQIVNNFSRFWTACQTVSEFECLASFKFKLIVRKPRKRTLNSIILPDDFKEKCLIIKNGKQIKADRILALIAMFLASLIFLILLFYFIWLYKDNLISNGSSKLDKKIYKKQLKKQRNEQINENLEIIKSFEHIKHDEQELLKKLRLEQERLSNKRREDEEFFNRIKKEELDLIKRKEQVIKEEEELLKKKTQFDGDEKKLIKTKKSSIGEIEMKLDQTKQIHHLGDELETKLDNIKLNRKELIDKSINLNIKGEIKLKNDDNFDLINLNDLSKKMKLNREKLFNKYSISKHKLKDNNNYIRSFDKLNKDKSKKIIRSQDRERFRLNLNIDDRKSLLKRKLLNAINKREKIKSPILKNQTAIKSTDNNLDIESKIKITKKNRSIFNSIGQFKIDANQCDKPIRLIVETPFPLDR